MELLQATATARACSLFRRDRAHADRQRSQAENALGGVNPGSRFAHIVEVGPKHQMRASSALHTSGQPVYGTLPWYPTRLMPASLQDTMVGSASLLQSLAGDAEKAASMLHSLAPEVWPPICRLDSFKCSHAICSHW